MIYSQVMPALYNVTSSGTDLQKIIENKNETGLCFFFYFHVHSALLPCCKYSLYHQLCINPWVKIVPNKCAIFYC